MSPTLPLPYLSVVCVLWRNFDLDSYSGLRPLSELLFGYSFVLTWSRLESSYEGHNYILQLESVLYIPTNRNNLISLGRWDKSGGRYTGGGGELILITKDGIPVSRGTKIENNLYKMMVTTHKPDITSTKRVKTQNQSFVIHEPVQSWETWHKRFGHISYSGLQHILDNNLVEWSQTICGTIWSAFRKEYWTRRSHTYGLMG